MTTALPERLTVGDLDFAVQESASRRTVGITVDRDGSLLLHAPAGCRPESLAAWANSKRFWVYKKLAEKDLLLSARPGKEFVTGEGFDYLGRRYRLQLVEGLSEDQPPVRLERGRLRMARSVAESGDPATAVIRWYRRRAFSWLPRRIEPWVRRMALHPGELDVRDLGYRWGSLGRNSRFNIHWATLQLPPSLVDYVIVHELAHIEHPQHTPAFWAAVERAMPDFETRKAQLAKVGAALWLG